MLRVVQFTCIAITALILWGLKSFLQATFQWGGPGFVDGFLFGMLFAVAGYLLIIWIDPSSRPRGSTSKQE